MLPELYAAVGGAMQDDFNFMNQTHCSEEKTRSLNEIKEQNMNTQTIISNVKLEESLEPDQIYKWHFNNIGTNLLRTSDDPLISSVQDTVEDELSIPVVSRKDRKTSKTSLVETKEDASYHIENNEGSTPIKAFKVRRKGPLKLRFHHQALPQAYLKHYENSQGNLKPRKPLEKIEKMGKELNKTVESLTPPSDSVMNNENILSWLHSILEQQQPEEINIKAITKESKLKMTQNQIPSIQHLENLPYMGEMTLENTKPRRGRKPKKADICHLIYKNYGTIVTGRELSETGTASSKECLQESKIKKKQKIDDKTKRKVKKLKIQCQGSSNGLELIDEPLNLCLRDSSPVPQLNSDSASARLFWHQMISLRAPNQEIKSYPTSTTELKEGIQTFSKLTTILEAPTKTPPEQNIKLLKHFLNESKEAAIMLENKTKSQSLSKKSDSKVTSTSLNTLKIPANSVGATTKRKRSAIFIPPVPAENSTKSATEVSICKFKFTGGAKPSLQEKKILSVDAGGNFRYYSGTGDKSMRGYEFFPRESLRQSSLKPGSHTNAFLNTPGEKMPNSSMDLSQQLLQFGCQEEMDYPDFDGKPYDEDTTSTLIRSSSPLALSNITAKSSDDQKRKKSSPRSLQRAKLERTFKEKGFLIQTQQLQSAEGATYCKFRQLRKFTRYLFRSWKDYLPNDEQREKASTSKI